MNVPHIVWVVVLVLGGQVLVWGLIFYRMGRQLEAIRTETWKSGEKIVLGPVRANYQGWNGRYGVSKTMGTLALLDRRILFKRPLGPDVIIGMGDIAEVSDTVALGSMKHTSDTYISLMLRDGSGVVFLAPNAKQWIDAIRERLVLA